MMMLMFSAPLLLLASDGMDEDEDDEQHIHLKFIYMFDVYKIKWNR